MLKKILVLQVLLLLTVNINANTKWNYSLEYAQKMAITSNKLILVDFWAVWCGPCKRMDSESWNKEDIGLLADNYIPVRIDIDNYKDIALKYQVKGIPYIFILDANGEVVYQQMSYMGKSQLTKLLKKFALNTSYMQRDLINYYKKANSNTSYRLAQDYQNYAIYLKKGVRGHFSSLASSYFSKTKKYLKLEKKNNPIINQKIALYEVQAVLIRNNYKKCSKILKKKFKEDKIKETNKKFYYFLNYVASKGLEDKDSDLWLSKLKTTENYQLYLKRADKILLGV
jgi:thiol-disulfide isomerase/thioredoxin